MQPRTPIHNQIIEAFAQALGKTTAQINDPSQWYVAQKIIDLARLRDIDGALYNKVEQDATCQFFSDEKTGEIILILKLPNEAYVYEVEQHYNKMLPKCVKFCPDKSYFTTNHYAYAFNSALLLQLIKYHLYPLLHPGTIKEISIVQFMEQVAKGVPSLKMNDLKADALETLIVKYAGIDQSQAKASYVIDREHGYDVRFMLALNAEDALKLKNHYEREFPGLITDFSKHPDKKDFHIFHMNHEMFLNIASRLATAVNHVVADNKDLGIVVAAEYVEARAPGGPAPAALNAGPPGGPAPAILNAEPADSHAPAAVRKGVANSDQLDNKHAPVQAPQAPVVAAAHAGARAVGGAAAPAVAAAHAGAQIAAAPASMLRPVFQGMFAPAGANPMAPNVEAAKAQPPAAALAAGAEAPRKIRCIWLIRPDNWGSSPTKPCLPGPRRPDDDITPQYDSARLKSAFSTLTNGKWDFSLSSVTDAKLTIDSAQRRLRTYFNEKNLGAAEDYVVYLSTGADNTGASLMEDGILPFYDIMSLWNKSWAKTTGAHLTVVLDSPNSNKVTKAAKRQNLNVTIQAAGDKCFDGFFTRMFTSVLKGEDIAAALNMLKSFGAKPSIYSPRDLSLCPMVLFGDNVDEMKAQNIAHPPSPKK